MSQAIPFSFPRKQLCVGLFGYGVVGGAVFDVLCQKPNLHATVKKICIKHPEKRRNIPAHFFTNRKEELLNDPEINVVIEVIDDADASFEIVRESLLRGKAVISANKKMIAQHFEELVDLQLRYRTPLLYEAACCASLPIIRNLEEYYDNELLEGIEGIINGSTNFILTKIFEENLSYSEALRLAQEKGFAESDPSLDVSGQDAANKLCILLAHAFGVAAKPQDLLFHGIEAVSSFDAEVAAANRSQIKLVARAVKLADGSVAAFVLPQFVKSDHLLFQVKNEFNGLALTGALADTQFFYGKGAGGYPTASAILSDLSALRYDYKYEHKKLLEQSPSRLADDVLLNAYVRFDDWEKVPVDAFEAVHEYYSGRQLHYRRGIVSLKKLRQNDWWRQAGVSLILEAEALAGKAETKMLQKELADSELIFA